MDKFRLTVSLFNQLQNKSFQKYQTQIYKNMPKKQQLSKKQRVKPISASQLCQKVRPKHDYKLRKVNKIIKNDKERLYKYILKEKFNRKKMKIKKMIKELKVFYLPQRLRSKIRTGKQHNLIQRKQVIERFKEIFLIQKRAQQIQDSIKKRKEMKIESPYKPKMVLENIYNYRNSYSCFRKKLFKYQIFQEQ